MTTAEYAEIAAAIRRAREAREQLDKASAFATRARENYCSARSEEDASRIAFAEADNELRALIYPKTDEVRLEV